MIKAGRYRKAKMEHKHPLLNIIIGTIILLLISIAALASSKEDLAAGLEADKKGNYDKALSLFSRAIAKNDSGKENLAWSYNNRGIIYRLKGNYALAIKDYTNAIKIKSDFAAAYSNRGLAYAKDEKYEQALADFNKSLQLNPKNADTHLKRGNAYFDKGAFDKAAADYSKAIAFKPDFTRAYYNRCDSYVKQRLFDQALKDCEKALEYEPQLESAKEMIRWLKSDKESDPPCLCSN